MVSRRKTVREGRLENVLHSELFIHQHNLQSFEERRDVQAFQPEMFALHCTACCTLCVCVWGGGGGLCAYVSAESVLVVKHNKRFGRQPLKTTDITKTERLK